MDRTDLQELIEVIASRLAGNKQEIPSPADAAAALAEVPVRRRNSDVSGDPARVIAGLLRSAPATLTEETGGPAAASDTAPDEDDTGLLGRVGRSLVTGLNVGSLIKGLVSANDGPTARLPRFPKFELPPPVRQEVAYSSRTGEYLEFDRSEAGMPRRRENNLPSAITINVQAMDSKSFLDHSNDIARAVREAMLSSHPLNDVVSEL